MRALILAAGRAVRLGPSGVELPKCLHTVNEVPLLERMLAALVACGVEEATIVIGHRGEQLRAACAALPAGRRPRIGFVENPDYARGSVLSLWSARALFARETLLLMDADVLFPVPLLQRLVTSEHPSAFLLDPRSEAGGEEMMLVARNGRVRRIARRVEPEAEDVVGEGVGFLKLSTADQHALHTALESLVEAGELDRDYEDGIDRFLQVAHVGYELVGELPWTEIDFPEDLARAREVVWPRIAALEGGAPQGGR